MGSGPIPSNVRTHYSDSTANIATSRTPTGFRLFRGFAPRCVKWKNFTNTPNLISELGGRGSPVSLDLSRRAVQEVKLSNRRFLRRPRQAWNSSRAFWLSTISGRPNSRGGQSPAWKFFQTFAAPGGGQGAPRSNALPYGRCEKNSTFFHGPCIAEGNRARVTNFIATCHGGGSRIEAHPTIRAIIFQSHAHLGRERQQSRAGRPNSGFCPGKGECNKLENDLVFLPPPPPHPHTGSGFVSEG